MVLNNSLICRSSIGLLLGLALSAGCYERPNQRVTSKPTSAPSDSSLQERLDFTIQNLGVVGLGARWCNERWRVQGQTLKLLHASTLDSLVHPQLTPTHFFVESQLGDDILVVISWIEDKPSLRRVTVINPATSAQVAVSIPESHLAKLPAEVGRGVIYTYLTKIPKANLQWSPGQDLVIHGDYPGAHDVKCYACIRPETKEADGGEPGT